MRSLEPIDEVAADSRADEVADGADHEERAHHVQAGVELPREGEQNRPERCQAHAHAAKAAKVGGGDDHARAPGVGALLGQERGHVVARARDGGVGRRWRQERHVGDPATCIEQSTLWPMADVVAKGGIGRLR
eukprot:5835960-Prymnesium_polylepis.3